MHRIFYRQIQVQLTEKFLCALQRRQREEQFV